MVLHVVFTAFYSYCLKVLLLLLSLLLSLSFLQTVEPVVGDEIPRGG